MDYLQQFYSMLSTFVTPSQPNRKLIAFGNVLLDRTVTLTDTELFDRFNLAQNVEGELDYDVLKRLTAEAAKRDLGEPHPGGSALNSVRILKQLGMDSIFFGAVGNDEHADELKCIFEKEEIDARLQTVDGVHTGLCVCLVYKENRSLFANIGASSKLSIDYLEDMGRDQKLAFLRPEERKQILYIEGFFLPNRDKVCKFIVDNYIRHRRKFAINLNSVYIVKENFETLLDLSRYAFFMFGNRNEFTTFAENMGCATIEDAAERLLQNSSKIIVITNGKEAVQLITNFVDENQEPGAIQFEWFKTPMVENVIDTTGAGDGFVAGFLHAWLSKRSLSECIRVGQNIAALICTQIGCNLPVDSNCV